MPCFEVVAWKDWIRVWNRPEYEIRAGVKGLARKDLVGLFFFLGVLFPLDVSRRCDG